MKKTTSAGMTQPGICGKIMQIVLAVVLVLGLTPVPQNAYAGESAGGGGLH